MRLDLCARDVAGKCLNLALVGRELKVHRRRYYLAPLLRLSLATVFVVLVVAGCAGNAAGSPTHIVRAWSAALNASDNDGAASLFAPGARIVQGPTVLTLHTHEDAVFWNASLPCSGKIVRLVRHGDEVTATFLLGDRRESTCDGPGQEATAIFRIRRGKIVLWHQLDHGSGSAPTV